jgi:O-antigen/teichoic acid export membrane protein
LKLESLTTTDAAWCVACMGLAIAVRWPIGLARGIITGNEEFVWLGAASTVLASLRAFGVFPVFMLCGPTPLVFFVWQAIVSVIEVAVFSLRARRLIPAPQAGAEWSWKPLRGMLNFSLGIAFLSAVWTGVTQLDRLLLSTLLPLSDYAVYALAVLAAGGVSFAVLPITSAMQPRLARLAAAGDPADVIAHYRRFTQVVAVVAGPLAAMLATHAEAVLFAWTGDRSLAAQGAPIATLYAIGNGLLAVASFQYYLQFAHGSMRLNIWANVVYAVILLPATVWAVLQWGAVGAGWTWLLINLVFLLVWTPVVHARFAPRAHRAWLCDDVARPLAIATAAALLASLLPHPAGRVALASLLICIGVGVALITAFASPATSTHLIRIVHRLRKDNA